MIEEKKSENLMDGLLKEIERVSIIATIYLEFPGGQFAAALMRNDIKEAREAISNGETIKMIGCYQKLKDYEL
ncbi:MAG: hypothetical protein ABUT20_43470 [Bacteroidota bacterium]